MLRGLASGGGKGNQKAHQNSDQSSNNKKSERGYLQWIESELREEVIKTSPIKGIAFDSTPI